MQRRVGVLAVVVALVVAATYGLFWFNRGDAPDQAGAPTSEAPAVTLPPVTNGNAGRREPALLSEFEDGVVGCEGISATHGPPLADLDEQLAVSRDALAVHDDRFTVVFAGPTHLGVVAAVRGDVEAARSELPEVAHVVRMRLAYSDLAPDRSFQMYAAVFNLLRPAVREVGLQVGSLPARPQATGWAEGGAVVITAPRPVPPEVRALAGMRDDGIRVVVEAARYSQVELAEAQRRLPDFLPLVGDYDSMASSPCGDGSALHVTLPTETPAADARELTRLLGVRVRVAYGSSIAE